MGSGRFVLLGEDEASEVKWHQPPVDMLTGAPDWLPHKHIRWLIDGCELGCVYWCENDTWSRAPYPDSLGDDGLECGMSQVIIRAEALSELSGYGLGTGTVPDADTLLTHAKRRQLTPDLLLRITDSPERDWDPPAMIRALHRTGLNASTNSLD